MNCSNNSSSSSSSSSTLTCRLSVGCGDERGGEINERKCRRRVYLVEHNYNNSSNNTHHVRQSIPQNLKRAAELTAARSISSSSNRRGNERRRSNHDKFVTFSLMVSLVAASIASSVVLCGGGGGGGGGGSGSGNSINSEVIDQRNHEVQPFNCLHNNNNNRPVASFARQRSVKSHHHIEKLKQPQVHHPPNDQLHNDQRQTHLPTSQQQNQQPRPLQDPLISRSIELSDREAESTTLAPLQPADSNRLNNGKRKLELHPNNNHQLHVHQAGHDTAPPCSDCLAIPLVAVVSDKLFNGYLIPPQALVRWRQERQLRKQTTTSTAKRAPAALANTSSENQSQSQDQGRRRLAGSTSSRTNLLTNDQQQPPSDVFRDYYPRNLHSAQHQEQQYHQLQQNQPNGKAERIMQHHELLHPRGQQTISKTPIEHRPFEPKSDDSCPMTGPLTVCDNIGSYPAEAILERVEFAKREWKRNGAFNIDSLFTDERDHLSEPFDSEMYEVMMNSRWLQKRPQKSSAPPPQPVSKTKPLKTVAVPEVLAVDSYAAPKPKEPHHHYSSDYQEYTTTSRNGNNNTQHQHRDARKAIAGEENETHFDDFLNLVEQRAFQLPARTNSPPEVSVFKEDQRHRTRHFANQTETANQDLPVNVGYVSSRSEAQDKYQPVNVAGTSNGDQDHRKHEHHQYDQQEHVSYQSDSDDDDDDDDVAQHTNLNAADVDTETTDATALASDATFATKTRDELVASVIPSKGSNISQLPSPSAKPVSAADDKVRPLVDVDIEAPGSSLTGSVGDIGSATISGKTSSSAIYEPHVGKQTGTGSGKPKRKQQQPTGATSGANTTIIITNAVPSNSGPVRRQLESRANIDFLPTSSKLGGAIKSVTGNKPQSSRVNTTNRTTIDNHTPTTTKITSPPPHLSASALVQRRLQPPPPPRRRRREATSGDIDVELDAMLKSRDSGQVRSRFRRQVSIVRVGASSGTPLRATNGQLISPTRPSLTLTTSTTTQIPDTTTATVSSEEMASPAGQAGGSGSMVDSEDSPNMRPVGGGRGNRNDDIDQPPPSSRLPESICRAKSIYITPKAALNDKKQWRYVVNAPDLNPLIRQIIRVDICEDPFGPCSDQVSLPFGFASQCKQKYSKKKLLALDSQSGLLEIDTFFIPSCCVCQLIPDPNSPPPFSSLEGPSASGSSIATSSPVRGDDSDSGG